MAEHIPHLLGLGVFSQKSGLSISQSRITANCPVHRFGGPEHLPYCEDEKVAIYVAPGNGGGIPDSLSLQRYRLAPNESMARQFDRKPCRIRRCL